MPAPLAVLLGLLRRLASCRFGLLTLLTRFPCLRLGLPQPPLQLPCLLVLELDAVGLLLPDIFEHYAVQQLLVCIPHTLLGATGGDRFQGCLRPRLQTLPFLLELAVGVHGGALRDVRLDRAHVTVGGMLLDADLVVEPGDGEDRGAGGGPLAEVPSQGLGVRQSHHLLPGHPALVEDHDGVLPDVLAEEGGDGYQCVDLILRKSAFLDNHHHSMDSSRSQRRKGGDAGLHLRW
mmetsp:Transcript_51489/g.135932  ORF Transcript_51489/g.135932 Transcript_51489/m.135932 type:complete len:234 (-) Transcript_51489:247-948(-)